MMLFCFNVFTCTNLVYELFLQVIADDPGDIQLAPLPYAQPYLLAVPVQYFFGGWVEAVNSPLLNSAF